jgi:hypothetical protein
MMIVIQMTVFQNRNTYQHQLVLQKVIYGNTLYMKLH